MNKNSGSFKVWLIKWKEVTILYESCVGDLISIMSSGDLFNNSSFIDVAVLFCYEQWF